jgi:hypothetical protein
MQYIARYIPHWLAWPVNLLSTLAAFAGAGLVFYAAAFGDGDYAGVVWGGIAFVVAAVLWHIADMASGNRKL